MTVVSLVAPFSLASATLSFRETLATAIYPVRNSDPDLQNAMVTTYAPYEDQIKSATNPGVNAYLLSVTRNPNGDNMLMPLRRGDGSLRPQAGPADQLLPFGIVDMRFLVTFYGDNNKLLPIRLLDAVLIALETDPTLWLCYPTAPEGLTSSGESREGADIVLKRRPTAKDESEPVLTPRIKPAPLEPERIAELWNRMFGTDYKLSVLYDVVGLPLRRMADAAPERPVKDIKLDVAADSGIEALQTTRPTRSLNGAVGAGNG